MKSERSSGLPRLPSKWFLSFNTFVWSDETFLVVEKTSGHPDTPLQPRHSLSLFKDRLHLALAHRAIEGGVVFFGLVGVGE